MGCGWFGLGFGVWMCCGLDLCTEGCAGGCLFAVWVLDLLARCLVLASWCFGACVCFVCCSAYLWLGSSCVLGVGCVDC